MLRIVLIGTYKPRQCGIAAFSAALAAALRELPGIDVGVVSVGTDHETSKFESDVIYEIQKGMLETYLDAAAVINTGAYDAVCLQHEYGLFGGDRGDYVLHLLEKLAVPCITTAHTVLSEPDRRQRDVLGKICALSERVIAISNRSTEFLHGVYGAAPSTIATIPHGTPVIAPTRQKKGDGHLLLTYGLLSNGKGIEYAIDALPRILQAHPNTRYVIAGGTHPNVKRAEGEKYRRLLEDRVAALGLLLSVEFRNEFLSDAELIGLLSRVSVCIMPYVNKEQISSGTIALAAAASKCIVSTGSWYAEEVLGQHRGVLVPFRDAAAIGDAVIWLLDNPDEMRTMERGVGRFAEEMSWSKVARQYQREFLRMLHKNDVFRINRAAGSRQ